MSSQRSSRQPSRPSAPDNQVPELVDPRWILKALFATLLVAMVFVYILLCVLFYFQQWQLVLRPSRTLSRNPSSLSLPFQEVHFSPDAAGKPQLDGWWIPSDTPADPTALLLHQADGSMEDALPLALELHDSRVNVLLFDYRGYGRSVGSHPEEKSMQADSESALTWLTTAGHAASEHLLVVGDGLGASLATQLCSAHPQVAGLILVDGEGDTAERAERDRRARLVPFRWLYHENFPLTDRLSTLSTPKLLVSHTSTAAPTAVQRAADPKLTYEIGAASSEATLHDAVRRFLSTYLLQPPQQLQPKQ